MSRFSLQVYSFPCLHWHPRGMGALCQMHLHGAPTSLWPSGGKGLPSFCGLFFCLFTHCKLQKSISTAFIIVSGSAFLSHQDQLETEKGTSFF